MNHHPPLSLPDWEHPSTPNAYNASRFDPLAASPGLTGLDLQSAIVRRAHELGFAAVGFLSAERFAEVGRVLQGWLDGGHHGAMGYMAELGPRDDPALLFPDARGMVVLAMPYPAHAHDSSLRVASYALGLDYHIALRGRMKRLSQALADFAGHPVTVRPIVDSAPLLEREAARLAGLGFIGKSTMLIVPGHGPRVLLGILLVDLPFASSTTPLAPRCGACTRCLDACPNRAFPRPWLLDARRCVSYLTIEHQGPIPPDLAEGCSGWVFGCDVCLDVCPFDRARPVVPELSEFAPRPPLAHVDPERWLRLSSADYRKLARRTALRRTDRTQLVRNAILACQGHPTPGICAALHEIANTHPIAWLRELAHSVLAGFSEPQESEHTP